MWPFEHKTKIGLHHTDAAGILFYSHIFTLAYDAFDAWLEHIGSAPENLVDCYNGYADIENAFPLLYQTEGYKFVYQDHINSTRQMSNSDVVRDYYPYGETCSSTGTATFEFSQKEYSSGIGLHYFGARYYNPGIGRCYAPDPAGQGCSPYVYCGDNPAC